MEVGSHSHSHSPKLRLLESKGCFWKRKVTQCDRHVLQSIKKSNCLVKDYSDLKRHPIKDEGRNSRRRSQSWPRF
jgi:hypothetical protein